MIKVTATSLLILVLFVLAGAGDARAGEFTILSNDELLEGAKSAGNQGDWYKAYGLLMAYIQRKPAELANDEKFAAGVSNGLKTLERNARQAEEIARKAEEI